MRASVGDRIVLAAEHVDGPTRDGKVLEARGADGGPPYLVQWSDGHTGLLFPGPGSVLRVSTAAEHEAPEPEAPDQAAAGPDVPAPRAAEPVVRDWTVRISVFAGDDSTASAVLVADPATQLRATGASHRGAHDPAIPRIGAEIAVARALRHLADQLIETATREVSEATGEREVRIGPF